ncbi:MAG: hypothetical protein GPJ54_00235, partial [Candidatus Heimdallarchaeota archaeon]|nr:hypothetical protein [Candidatus Heimdallarchaeota archaeon]
NTKDLKHVTNLIDDQHKTAMHNWRQTNDFDELRKSEANLRKNYLRLIFESSSRYGNTVFKRYQDPKGDMDPMNMLFNIAGALMRAFAEEFYPLPSFDERIGKDRGYISQKHAFVTITHPNIPSLDLIDMTRAHMWFLCHHLFIYRVNSFAATRYLMILLFKFKSYLYYIYAGGGQGRKIIEKKYNSILDMDKDLYDVIRLAKYDRETNHAVHRVTQLELPDTKNKLFDMIKDEIDDININDKFYLKVVELFEIEQKKIGTIRHQEIMSGLPQPYNLRDIVFNGDKYVQNNSGYLVVAELPIPSKKSAKIDFVIFKRILRKTRYIWIPVIILDLKTKTDGAFDFKSQAVRGRPELKQPKPVIKLEPVDEWHMTVSNAMNKHASNQLNTYVQIIRKEMNGILREVQHAPLQGIVAIRAENNDLRDSIQNLLYSLPEYLLENYKDLGGCYFYPEDEDIAVIFKDFQNIELLRDPKAGKKNQYIPQLSRAEKNITLYVTCASNINFGKTAANIAAVYDCIKTVVEDHGEIIVLDTLDVYSDFTTERMRLPQEFLDKVEIIPLDVIDPDLDMLRQIKKPVVITGWADSKTMITRPWDKEQLILENINTEYIYLIDRAVKGINTSKIYNDRCILPYREYSKRKNYISKIIYNLPVPPKKIKKPLYDDVRVIIGEKAEITICPALTGIAMKFEKTDRRKKIDSNRNLSLIKLEEVYDLIAHMRTEYSLEKLTFDYSSLGEREELIQLFHLPLVKEKKKKEVNREFRSRNPFKRIVKMYQRTYRVPYSNEFGRRTLVVEALDDVKVFIEAKEDLNYILEDFEDNINYNIMQSLILSETRLGLNLLPLIEDHRYNFYKTYCMLDMNYEKFKENTNWYNLLFLALRSIYPLRDNHLIQLWRQFSTWMLYTLGYEMRSNIKYIFNIANIWRQLESRCHYYLSLDGEVIRHMEQGVMEIGDRYSIIRFEDSRGLFEFTDHNELREVHWQVSHADVVLSNFELKEIIPICSGYLGTDRYLWSNDDWSEVRKLRMRVDELKEWNIRNIQLIPCNLEEIPSVDPYIPETRTLDITYVGCNLEYNDGIEMTIYSKKTAEISEQIYKVFDNVEELMEVLRHLWGNISHPLEIENYYCRIEFRYDIDWGVFVSLSKYLGKIDVPFILEDFEFVEGMEKIYLNCYLNHNEEICEEGHPNCWIWESYNEDLDYYLSDYASTEDIKEIFDKKIIELEDIDKIYFLNFKFDENRILYQENKIIKSLLSRHTINRYLLLEYKSYEKEVTKTLEDISHDSSNNTLVLTFVNNITKESEIELISYIAENKREQMQEILSIFDGFDYQEGIYPENVFKEIKEECESYLEEYPLAEIDNFEMKDPTITISDFDCDEVDYDQYHLQLKIDDQWHNYENNPNRLLGKDEVIRLIDQLLQEKKKPSGRDILSNLIDYFIEIDLTDHEIIPDGNMEDIEEILSELKEELLKNEDVN